MLSKYKLAEYEKHIPNGLSAGRVVVDMALNTVHKAL